MALAAAEKEHGALDEDTAERIKAYSAATDNVGLFFGEDIFIAIRSIILIALIVPSASWSTLSQIIAAVIHGPVGAKGPISDITPSSLTVCAGRWSMHWAPMGTSSRDRHRSELRRAVMQRRNRQLGREESGMGTAGLEPATSRV